MYKKIICLILAAVLTAVMLSSAFAEEPKINPIEISDFEGYSGNLNNSDISWTLDDNGTLTLTGSGDMPVIYDYNTWLKYKGDIKNVVISQGITSVANAAFSGCANLESISLPDSITIIGRNAFANTALYSNSDNWYNDVFYIDNFLIKAKETVTSHTVKDGTKVIANSAFSDCKDLTDITIAQSVTVIGNSAFSGCSKLAAITVTDGISEIGDEAFAGTAFYNNPENWNEDALYIGSCLLRVKTETSAFTVKDGTKTLADYALGSCKNLETVIIPDGVENIGGSAFSYCQKLTSAVLPDSVKRIGSGAFGNCTNLENINIPEGIERIESGTFSDCSKLTAVPMSNNVRFIGSNAFKSCKNILSISIPDGVSDIGGGAFEECENLSEITVPHGVKNIKANTFSGCKNLISVQFQGVIDSIGWDAFKGCTGIMNITLPNGLKKIGRSAFEGCGGLKEIIIPSSVTDIEYNAFASCTNLANVVLPNKITAINGGIFSGCISLSGIDIPNGVTGISASSFANCTALKTVNIPNTVTYIGSGAFKGCKSLADINIPESVASIGEGAFEGTAVYNNAENLDGNMIYISNCLVYVKPTLTSCTIKNGTRIIADYAFYNSGITNITIPKSVTAIGREAFSGCDRLTDVSIPGSVESIGIYAFRGCDKLRKLTIYKGIANIMASAFSGCDKLSEVFFTGSQSDWDKIFIDSGNETITSKVQFLSMPAIDAKPQKTSGGVSLDYTLENISQPANILIAGYKNGVIVDKIITREKSGTEELKGDFDKIKIMAWEDFKTLNPLSDSADLTNEDW